MSNPSPPAESSGNRRVLLVDDNVDAAETLAMLLQMDGHEVLVEHDGAGALRRFAQFRPDVVILDIGLPDIDGYAVATQLRAGPHSALLIALTGWNDSSHKQLAKQAGFDVHFAKPVDFDDLSKCILQWTAAS